MKNVLLPASLLALVSTTAFADSTTQTDAPAKPSIATATRAEAKLPIAIGVNLPLRWKDGESIGGSLYVGLTKRLALRGNVASYEYVGGMFTAAGAVASLLNGGDSEAYHGGRITDVGVGLVLYSNKMWDGFTVEAGLLRRATNISTSDDYADEAYVATDSTTYAARALVGYSWLVGEHFFVAFALGMSGGHESGTQTARMESHSQSPLTTRSVSRWEASPEGYVRIGGAFNFGGGEMRRYSR
ncbi:MAG: hypothetical protein H0T46_29895 [Deltaproteobacteria bacterium]|nr:hypothetical protein [Deltaproteobacteria bacterium]